MVVVLNISKLMWDAQVMGQFITVGGGGGGGGAFCLTL